MRRNFSAVPPPFGLALLRRAAGLWLLVRAGILAIGLLLDLAPLAELTFLTRPAAGFAVLLVAWLAMFDARRRGEALFLADLGVTPAALLGLVAAPPLAGELVMAIAGRV